jgi:hypothetical protein
MIILDKMVLVLLRKEKTATKFIYYEFQQLYNQISGSYSESD